MQHGKLWLAQSVMLASLKRWFEHIFSGLGDDEIRPPTGVKRKPGRKPHKAEDDPEQPPRMPARQYHVESTIRSRVEQVGQIGVSIWIMRFR